MNVPQASRSDCIGMIGAVMVELLAIASREDLQAALAWLAAPEAANAWGAIESMHLVAERMRPDQVVIGGPCLGPM